MSATPKQTADKPNRTDADACSTPLDPKAPAGQPGSLGSKSDCNGRPSTDDSVVEGKDEMGPGLTPAATEADRSQR
jgi:hypothetical protein